MIMESLLDDGMAQSSRRPIAIDLFAGAGGFSLGIEQAGFDVAIAVENDPVHAATYTFNFPQTQMLWGDAAALSGEDLRSRLSNPTLDLIFGGPPCQGFSVMGKHDLKDSRNRLVFHFCRLVRELQPRYFIMENVPGLTHTNNRVLLRRLKQEFKAAGYKIAEPVCVLNAAKFGIPQTRQRLFLLGTRQGEVMLSYPQPTDTTVTVRDAIADLPNLDAFPELQSQDEILLKSAVVEQLEASASTYAKKLRGLVPDPDNFAYPRTWNPLLFTGSWQTQHTKAVIKRFGKLPPGQQDKISRLRRLEWTGCCYTLRAGTGGDRGSHTAPRPLHPQYNRTISVREAARLHSFPDWFRLHATKWHGFRQIGNAVPPLLGRVLGSCVLRAIAAEPPQPSTTLELGDKTLLRLKHRQAVKRMQFARCEVANESNTKV